MALVNRVSSVRAEFAIKGMVPLVLNGSTSGDVDDSFAVWLIIDLVRLVDVVISANSP
jgi:hypothetical protein